MTEIRSPAVQLGRRFLAPDGTAVYAWPASDHPFIHGLRAALDLQPAEDSSTGGLPEQGVMFVSLRRPALAQITLREVRRQDAAGRIKIVAVGGEDAPPSWVESADLHVPADPAALRTVLAGLQDTSKEARTALVRPPRPPQVAVERYQSRLPVLSRQVPVSIGHLLIGGILLVIAAVATTVAFFSLKHAANMPLQARTEPAVEPWWRASGVVQLEELTVRLPRHARLADYRVAAGDAVRTAEVLAVFENLEEQAAADRWRGVAADLQRSIDEEEQATEDAGASERESLLAEASSLDEERARDREALDAALVVVGQKQREWEENRAHLARYQELQEELAVPQRVLDKLEQVGGELQAELEVARGEVDVLQRRLQRLADRAARLRAEASQAPALARSTSRVPALRKELAEAQARAAQHAGAVRFEVRSPRDGTVLELVAAEGAALTADAPLLRLRPSGGERVAAWAGSQADGFPVGSLVEMRGSSVQALGSVVENPGPEGLGTLVLRIDRVVAGELRDGAAVEFRRPKDPAAMGQPAAPGQ